MRHSTWILLVLITAGFSATSKADLLDEVDKLTPEQAYLFEQKLEARVLSPVPESFFTRLTVAVSGGVGVYDPSSYNSYLAANQAKITTSGVWQANVMWKLPDAFLLGFMTSISTVDQIQEPLANVFYHLSVVAPSIDLAAAYRIDISDSVFLVPTLGIGGILALVDEETTTDATKTTYDLRYRGAAFHLALQLPIYYRINRVWSIGLTNGFQLANLTDFERKEDHPADVPNLSLTGYQGTLSIAFNL